MSKDWLKGADGETGPLLRPAQWYSANQVDLILGDRAASIDTERKRVALSSGSTLGYQNLILATGSRAIWPLIVGIDQPWVRALRSGADAEAIKAHLRPGKRIGIVGGGYIGLEVAASAIQLGAVPFVIEREDRLLSRSASAGLSEFIACQHESRGVKLFLGGTVTGFSREEGGKILLSDGSAYDADLAIVGIGAVPNTEIAESAGLACERGIIVNEEARTSDPSIFAIGDVATRWDQETGTYVRFESVANATEQARQAACAIVGRPQPRAEVPWNWSDQFDFKVQIAGSHCTASHIVTRGISDENRLAIFHLNEKQQLEYIEAVNMPSEFMAGKKLIVSGQSVDPDLLADEGFDLSSLFA